MRCSLTTSLAIPLGLVLVVLPSKGEGQAVKPGNPPPQERATLRGHTDCVFSVAFSPDGTTLAAGGPESTIKLRELPFPQARKR
jgi:WD40 repeat protein